MQGSEHSGKMEMSWADATAARVRMALVYSKPAYTRRPPTHHLDSRP